MTSIVYTRAKYTRLYGYLNFQKEASLSINSDKSSLCGNSDIDVTKQMR